MQIFGRFLDWRYGSGLTSWPRYSKLCSKKHEQTSHEHKICRKCCLIPTLSLPNYSVSKVTIGFSETVLRSMMDTQSAFNYPKIPCAKALVSLFSQIIVECTCEINAAEGHDEGKKGKKIGVKGRNGCGLTYYFLYLRYGALARSQYFSFGMSSQSPSLHWTPFGSEVCVTFVRPSILVKFDLWGSDKFGKRIIAIAKLKNIFLLTRACSG